MTVVVVVVTAVRGGGSTGGSYGHGWLVRWLVVSHLLGFGEALRVWMLRRMLFGVTFAFDTGRK